jgi:hypothetical protein
MGSEHPKHAHQRACLLRLLIEGVLIGFTPTANWGTGVSCEQVLKRPCQREAVGHALDELHLTRYKLAAT